MIARPFCPVRCCVQRDASRCNALQRRGNEESLLLHRDSWDSSRGVLASSCYFLDKDEGARANYYSPAPRRRLLSSRFMLVVVSSFKRCLLGNSDNRWLSKGALTPGKRPSWASNHIQGAMRNYATRNSGMTLEPSAFRIIRGSASHRRIHYFAQYLRRPFTALPMSTLFRNERKCSTPSAHPRVLPRVSADARWDRDSYIISRVWHGWHMSRVLRFRAAHANEHVVTKFQLLGIVHFSRHGENLNFTKFTRPERILWWKLCWNYYILL